MSKKASIIFYIFIKRIIDVVISLLALTISSPVLLLTALLIKIDSKGPVIFFQERVGVNGKIFRFYKFRSMIQNAETLLYNNKVLLEEYKKNSYKILKDPRVTRVGRIIRRFSIDEFPQFINVLKGDMSFVGPRAYRPEELADQQEKYPETKKYVKSLLTVKPGITGPWQVSGRSEINFDKRVEMDAYYANRKSILYDFIIILRTPLAVIKARGAV